MPIYVPDNELDEGLDAMRHAQSVPCSRTALVRSILKAAIEGFRRTGDAQAWRNKNGSASKSAPPKAQHSKSDASPSIPGNTPDSSGSAKPVSKPSGSSVPAKPSAPARANGAATPARPSSKPTAHSPKPKAAPKAQPAQRRAGANLQGSIASPA